MKTPTRMILYLILLALIDTFLPIPITAIILIYVILEKPPWFKELVTEIYAS